MYLVWYIGMKWACTYQYNFSNGLVPWWLWPFLLLLRYYILHVCSIILYWQLILYYVLVWYERVCIIVISQIAQFHVSYDRHVGVITTPVVVMSSERSSQCMLCPFIYSLSFRLIQGIKRNDNYLRQILLYLTMFWILPSYSGII